MVNPYRDHIAAGHLLGCPALEPTTSAPVLVALEHLVPERRQLVVGCPSSQDQPSSQLSVFDSADIEVEAHDMPLLTDAQIVEGLSSATSTAGDRTCYCQHDQWRDQDNAPDYHAPHLPLGGFLIFLRDHE